MTLCLDLTAAAHEKAGLGRYAAHLAQALLQLGVPLAGFVNARREARLPAPLRDLRLFSAELARKPWRLRAALSYFGGPSLDRALPGVTFFHATEHLLPYLTHAKSAITLHDVAYLRYPQYHLWQNRWYLQLMVPRFLARADAVICVSEFTRQDALHFYHLPPEKVHVITEGVEPRFQPIFNPQILQALRAKYHLPERFILFVGTIEPRKNLAVLLEAYQAVRAECPAVGLVIAGGKGWLYQTFFERLKALGLEEVVTFTGYVPDEDLPALLNCAEVFAFPSVFEGFGLPPLEAMACGVPVVCSNASSLPEVVGEAGILLQPTAPQLWAEALLGVLRSADQRAELRERGRKHARQFTWEHTARQTLDVYQALGYALP